MSLDAEFTEDTEEFWRVLFWFPLRHTTNFPCNEKQTPGSYETSWGHHIQAPNNRADLEFANDFAASWCCEADENIEADVFADKSDSTITHREVCTTGMERVR